MWGGPHGPRPTPASAPVLSSLQPDRGGRRGRRRPPTRGRPQECVLHGKLNSMPVLRLTLLFATLLPLAAQQFSSDLYGGLRWRTIGPYRGGRTVAAAGIPTQPNVFYVAANDGGIWKTDDFGRTWKPLFDDQPTGSIGA